MNQAARAWLVAVVGAAWATSFVASLANHDYHPDPSVNAAFMLVIGAAIYKGGAGGGGGEGK